MKKTIKVKEPEVIIEAVKWYSECTVCDWKSECMTSPPLICGRCGASVIVSRCGAVKE